MILNTKYKQAWIEGDIFVFRWKPETVMMKEKEYIQEIILDADVIRKHRKPYILLLTKEMQFVISITLQEFANDILLPAYNDSGVKKLAVVVPEHMIVTMSVEQTIEERRLLHSFETRFFSDEEEAREWLLLPLL